MGKAQQASGEIRKKTGEGRDWPGVQGVSWTRTSLAVSKRAVPRDARKTHFSPEEKAEGPHLAKVHTKDPADLLEGKHLLLLVPPGILRLPVVVLEVGVGVEAGGRAGGAGHVVVTRLPGAGVGGPLSTGNRVCSHPRKVESQ